MNAKMVCFVVPAFALKEKKKASKDLKSTAFMNLIYYTKARELNH